MLALDDLPGDAALGRRAGPRAARELPGLGWRARTARDPPLGAHGASPGRSGELRDELRVERLDGDRLRIARWIMRPEPGLGASGGARTACRRTASSERWGPRPSAACSCRAVRWSSDYLRVPLKLVTGPANAAKAGEVLGGLRNRLDEDPILVVPTLADVEHAQRELAERGAVFGARVMRFRWLFEEIAAAPASTSARPPTSSASFSSRRRCAGARLDVLAESAAQPGFVRAAAHFFAELGPGAR